jgi:hypothetical protein
MLTLLFLSVVAQADAGWAASVGDEAQGERVVRAVVSPLPAPKAVRLVLTPVEGPAKQIDYDAAPGWKAIAIDLREALDVGSATLFVLTLDTLVPLEVGQLALGAAAGTTATVELRFAGPTRIKGQPMPDVMQLVKVAPPAPPLSQTQIRGVFQGAYGQLRACYQQQLEGNALEGRLEVELRVVTDGSVSDARLKKSELSAPQVEQCVLGVVKGLRFPRLRGAQVVKVAWPFLFKKGADAPVIRK